MDGIKAQEQQQRFILQLRDTSRAINAAAKASPPRRAGECDLCGEWSGRLIEAACAPCRDRHKLP
jgi:hypothetical protein